MQPMVLFILAVALSEAWERAALRQLCSVPNFYL